MAIEFVYEFKAVSSSRGRPVTGQITAGNELFAMSRIKRMGFTRVSLVLDLFASIRIGFGYFAPKDFNLREKARLFETVGKRLQRDGSLGTALENAQEYIQDHRLLGASAIAAGALADGRKPYDALAYAGFSKREAMVVRALDESGRLDKAFLDMAVEAKMKQMTSSAISSAMFMPRVVMGAMYFIVPGFFFGVGPKMAGFFKKAGANTIQMPDGVKEIYQLVDWVNANASVSIMVWVAVGLGVLYMRTTPQWKQMFMALKPFRDLATKSEHSQLWSTYALMYGAGIPPVEICAALAPTVTLPETADSIRVFERRLAAGTEESDAIEAARFPRFVVSGYRAAKDSGSLGEGLTSFAQMLGEDVELLTQSVKRWLEMISLSLLIGMIFVVFLLFYYPIAGPLLKSL